LFVLVTIVMLNRFGRGFVWSISIALGLVAGYLLAALLGRVDVSGFGDAGWFALPVPLKYGLDFQPAYLLPWLVGYLVTTIESMGDLTATSVVSRQPVAGPVFIRRLQGGVLADGIGSLFAGLFCAMPNTTFSQNNGVIALTGVAARRAGFVVAGLLAVLGLFPKLAFLISVMPKPVLGGATLVMFATVAVAGFRIVVQDGFSPRNQFVVAISLALGLGVTVVPEAFAGIGAVETESAVLALLLPFAQVVLQSGLALGAVVAVALNALFPVEPMEAEPG
jgi:NCS2 family nucleobase:cation symporter-2/xanthine permease XanP